MGPSRALRRRGVLVAALACVFVASLTANAAPRTYPVPGCNIFTDPASDATPVGEVATPDPAGFTVLTSEDTNAASFDITGVSYRLSDTTFSTVVRVPGLDQNGYSRGLGDAWISTFTAGKKVVAIRAGRVSGRADLDSVYATQAVINRVTIDTVANKSIPVGADFDYLNGYVVISAAREPLEQALGASLGEIKSLMVQSATNVVAAAAYLDTATAPAKLVANPADNFCF